MLDDAFRPDICSIFNKNRSDRPLSFSSVSVRGIVVVIRSAFVAVLVVINYRLTLAIAIAPSDRRIEFTGCESKDI
jgi:hypothetical protein